MEMDVDRLPTFICIGAMKCGTSSLHQYLGAHPWVCMSSPKETNYFLARSNQSLQWYRERFNEPEKVCGETSPNYSKHPEFGCVNYLV